MRFELLPATSRRQFLRTLTTVAAGSALPVRFAMGEEPNKLSREDEGLLDDLEKCGCLLFWSRAVRVRGRFWTGHATISTVRAIRGAWQASQPPGSGSLHCVSLTSDTIFRMRRLWSAYGLLSIGT